MGVWIETDVISAFVTLKKVTPRVGVWIETTGWRPPRGWRYVTPRVGVWIETADVVHIGNSAVSLPAWECGLKQKTIAGGV